jgi:hypothetical protein
LFELLKREALGTVLFSGNQKHPVTVHKTRSILDRMSLNSEAVSKENCSIVSGNWTTRQGTLHGGLIDPEQARVVGRDSSQLYDMRDFANLN